MMKNSPYKIDNRKSGFLTSLASGAVAVGSVASAVVMVVPGMPGYDLLANSENQSGSNSDSNSNSENTLVNSSGIETVAADVQVETASLTDSSGKISAGTNNSVGNQIKSKKKNSNLQLPAALPGVDQGNTSSPTPTSGGGSTSNQGGTGGGSGNVSSPTPGGSGSGVTTPGGGTNYEEEEEYEDEEEEYEDE